MVFHFLLRYRTRYGQAVNMRMQIDGNWQLFPLTYFNEESWQLLLDAKQFGKQSVVEYYYEITESGSSFKDQGKNRFLHPAQFNASIIKVIDDWQAFHVPKDVFLTGAFDILKVADNRPDYSNVCHTHRHVFHVDCLLLKKEWAICMLGSGKTLQHWSESNPLLMRKEKDGWELELNFDVSEMTVEYKYGIYDTVARQFLCYEPVNNRKLELNQAQDTVVFHRNFADFHRFGWKANGINVQLSALRSSASWGVGDFSDLKVLIDWTALTGSKMVQLLPINDTTTNRTKRDSYPYSAISAFAQHPIFLDVSQVAQKYKFPLSDDWLAEARKLNASTTLEYEQVLYLKTKALRLIFEKAINSFQEEKAFKHFYKEHQSWLLPYAAFCALRDHYGDADFSNWEAYAKYQEKKIKKLTDKENAHHSELMFNFFIQYHLHIQLTEAVEYAHQNGVIIKGDLPIGVGRHSVETWMYPQLFHMDMQAGAPPDAFATKGQNWSFPTYNWERMKEDGYQWWRTRLQHMNHYFDATRVDHVLGFFRIWSIPLHALDGIFGYFVPANPLRAEDFIQKGLQFDAARLCDPFITDDQIQVLFSTHADWVRQNAIIKGHLSDNFNTQIKIESFDKKHGLNHSVKKQLMDLLSNVILIRDEKDKDAFHFRIDMQKTFSFQKLSPIDQQILNEMYVDYFYRKQNELWHLSALEKLDAIQKGSSMLICAEDLGMVPEMVEEVLRQREMLALQVQRMPKKQEEAFSMPETAPYLSVVTPSTHDMSTIRQWWEEDKLLTQQYYTHSLKQQGGAPFYCEPWICRKIIQQHLHSPAMWTVFLLQDLLSISAVLRCEDPHQERINIPADPHHFWNYRMHLDLNQLLDATAFNQELKKMIQEAGRA